MKKVIPREALIKEDTRPLVGFEGSMTQSRIVGYACAYLTNSPTMEELKGYKSSEA